MVVPSLYEFEEALFFISREANARVMDIYNKEKAAGNITPDGLVNDACCIGSTIMYLDRRKPLYKFLSSIPEDPQKFYFVMDHGKSVSISLRDLYFGQSYTLRSAAYQVVADRLKEKFDWEIFNNVNID